MREIARQALLLSAKDIRIFARDWSGLAFALILPLVFVFGFSLAFGGVGPDDERLRLAAASEEAEGSLSRQAIDALAASPESGVTPWSPAAAAAAVEDGSLSGYVLFSDGFTQRVLTGAPAEIRVVLAGGAPPETEAALRGLAAAVAQRIGAVSLVAQGAVELAGPAALDPAALARIAEAPPLISFAMERVGPREAFNASNFTLPGYLTMFVFFIAAMNAEAIARERQAQTLERLLSNGVRRSAIILGKLLAGLYRGFIQLAVLWPAGIFAFSIDFGVSPVAVVGVSVMMVAAAAAFGVMLAALVSTAKSAMSAAVFTSLTLAPLGGSWWPLFVAPDWLQTLGLFTPHGWANDAFNKLMLFGAEAPDVFTNLGVLALFAAAFLSIALLRFRSAPAS